MDIVSTILPIVFIVVGVLLVWLIVELAVTARKARTTVEDVRQQVEGISQQVQPTLASAQRITASLEPVAEDLKDMTATLKPAVERVDPLVERVSLTVDAANLEIMRLDQILEDVNDITASASSAVSAVETATNAPLAVVNTVTDRVRGAFKARRASDESIALGEKKAEALSGAPEPNPVGDLVSESIDAASRLAGDARAAVEERRAAHAAAPAETRPSVSVPEIGADAAKSQAKQDDGYFTYTPVSNENDER